MSPLHQQETIVERRSPLDTENRWKDRSFRICSTKKGDDRMVSKKEGQLLEDFKRRSSPFMQLPKLNMSGDYFRSDSMSSNERTTKDDSSPVSFIDGVMEVIDLKFEDEWESDDDVMIVPVKSDNYVSKRSSRLSKRRKELLLDNASAITDALRVLQEGNTGALSSEDEESIDAGDIDDGYDSDQL